MRRTCKITSKGRVTIPQEIKERLSLLPHTEVEFILKDGEFIIRKSATKRNRPTSRRTKLLHSIRGRATVRISTDQILALTRK